ncbi:signal transduction histidine kinase [Owenweeksia hongkongensis DSM 17368]|uniref:histidine kinase n=1 Tax=Owenweeksia hongkongensis (strain DSM 17368 / CIP 108786 / JCM 12287 / NRRL B-23963 / UST20020801) TaxID=926562 RepID=G8R4J4_OWEHD|nr:histidine kinase N-terminal 7TM domain-containing protein [Owenweeksia hongkongensis]AEV32083.1 signal transduction histidine kinase [Owenweeksia hongkongensis DSM 17368]
MELVLNSYSISLIVFSLIALFLAGLVYNRIGLVAKWFAACMAVISIWAAGYGISIAQNTIGEMIFWINVEYIGIVLTPTIWFVFVLKFTGRDCKLNKTIFSAFFGFAGLSLLMVWTNPLHHLHYADYQIQHAAGHSWLLSTPGPWYYIHVAYFYTLIASGIYVLIKSIRLSSGVFRQQSLVILIGALVPWAANVSVIFRTGVFGHIDSTPFAFLISAIAIGIGFLQFKLFDVVPMARDKVINVMREGWLVLDPQNRIIDFNPKMAWIMQKESQNLSGLHFGGLEGAKQEEVDYLLDLSHENDVDVEVEIGNELFSFEVTCKTIKENNSNKGRLLIFRNITQYKEDQRKLQQQSEELKELNVTKGRLLSIISHDVRGPLAVLTQILEMSGRGELSEDDLKELLPKLGENLNNITGFLDNLLVWAKSQFEGEMISPKMFDISTEIRKNIGLLSATVEAKNIKVFFDEKEEFLVWADPNMIRLVVRNLLGNAVKFCRPGDEIKFGITRKDEHVEISVSDSGIGISEENLERIFSSETFTTHGTEMEQGTGLGLMLSKDFVTKNEGKIWAESKVGIGSIFYFTIPIAPKSKEASLYHLHNY